MGAPVAGIIPARAGSTRLAMSTSSGSKVAARLGPALRETSGSTGRFCPYAGAVSNPVVDGTVPPGEVWHFSEDPNIRELHPHVAVTAHEQTPYVWACRAARCPDYWFARQTPRAMAWRVPTSAPSTADAILGSGVERLHVIEFSAVDTITTTHLFAYRFLAADFHDVDGYASVSEHTQIPLGPPVSLATPWQLHQHAGIPVVVVHNLFR